MMKAPAGIGTRPARRQNPICWFPENTTLKVGLCTTSSKKRFVQPTPTLQLSCPPVEGWEEEEAEVEDDSSQDSPTDASF